MKKIILLTLMAAFMFSCKEQVEQPIAEVQPEWVQLANKIDSLELARVEAFYKLYGSTTSEANTLRAKLDSLLKADSTIVFDSFNSIRVNQFGQVLVGEWEIINNTNSEVLDKGLAYLKGGNLVFKGAEQEYPIFIKSAKSIELGNQFMVAVPSGFKNLQYTFKKL